MPKTVRISKTAIDNLIDIAAKVPAKEPSDFARKDALERLLPSIENLQEKGYNLEEISKLLTDNNIAVSTAILRQYLTEFSKKASADKIPLKPKKTVSKKLSSTSKLNDDRLKEETSITEKMADEPPASSEEQHESLSKIEGSANKDLESELTVPSKPQYKSPPKPGSEGFK